jgi:hypothetical protein
MVNILISTTLANIFYLYLWLDLLLIKATYKNFSTEIGINVPLFNNIPKVQQYNKSCNAELGRKRPLLENIKRMISNYC